MDDLKNKLELVRKFTGDRFSAARGYDLRKPMSRRRLRTIDRYFNVISELTARDYVVYTPKRGEKREVFEFTGQKGFGNFTRAIIHSPQKEAKYTYKIDKERPKGSRFVVENKQSGERSWHIPAHLFWQIFDDLSEEEKEDIYTQILEEYGDDAEVFLINAGDFHMWGTAGNAPIVARKISELFRNYGADVFDPNDKNSNYIGNWFRGVTAYKPRGQINNYITERYHARRQYLEDMHRANDYKFRYTRDGRIVAMQRGSVIFELPRPTPENIEPYDPNRPKRKHKKKVRKGRSGKAK